MALKTVCLITSLLAISLYAKEEKYLTSRKTIAEARAIESGFGSELLGFKKLGVSEGFFDGAQKGKEYYPLAFRRTNDGFYPNLNVEYFYTGPDSAVNAVVYDWDIMNHVSNLKTDAGKLEEQVPRMKAYEAKYDDVKMEMIRLLGQPAEDKKETTDKGYFYFAKWEKENAVSELRLSFTPTLQNIGPFRFGTFRIRLKTFWKK